MEAIVRLLRPEAVVSKLISGAGAWSIRYGAQGHPGFAILLEGSCFLKVDGGHLVELHKGDFVLLPGSPAFTMTSDPKLEPTLLRPSNPRELRHGTPTGPASVRMLGGHFQVDRDNAQLVLDLLPPMIHIQATEPSAHPLRMVTQLIAGEATQAKAGRELILQRLVEVVLVEALRHRPGTSRDDGRGLLAGMSDSGLVKALRRIHGDAARQWTVAELAKVAGMSRAVFAERFNRKVGMPPMQYVVAWRMALAKDLLRRERPSLTEVAERVGYQSASAFSTAFTRLTGKPPSVFAAQVTR